LNCNSILYDSTLSKITLTMDVNQGIDLENIAINANHLIEGLDSFSEQTEIQIIPDVPPGYTALSASILLGSSFP
ncbi:18015_t:CDS:1, partial [Racocetra persica]